MADCSTTDTELLALSAVGDRAAFSAFMRRHAGGVRRFIFTLGATDADAEDALQECFVAAWRSAATYEGNGPARSWLLTIARNALLRLNRKRVGEPDHVVSLEALGAAAGWGSSIDLLGRIEAMDELRWALKKLTDREREVIVLRDLIGLDNHEVADLLGLSYSAVKSRLHRGRLRLMSLIRGVDLDE